MPLVDLLYHKQEVHAALLSQLAEFIRSMLCLPSLSPSTGSARH